MTGVFVMPHSESYDGYIAYMARTEATRTKNFYKFNGFEDVHSKNVIEGADEAMFSTYNDYMSNPMKTKSLFNRTYDQMPYNVIQYTKNYFTEGQEKGSPMWQIVFSFRNDWLSSHGLFDEQKFEVKELKLADATRQAMDTLIKKEGLVGEWSSSIHYNTDNIHVHVGFVEKNPTREFIFYEDKKNPENTGWQYKGKFLKSSILATKRTFVNNLLDMQKELSIMDEKIKNIVGQIKKNPQQFKEELFKEKFLQLYDKLPKNKRRWVYGYAKGQKFKPEIDAMITLYINSFAKDEFNQLVALLKPISDEYEEAYGNPKNAPTFLENKLYGKDGLYHTLGNVILKEVKEYDKEVKQHSRPVGRLTMDDLKQLKIEESCIRSNLPNADMVFVDSETDEYDFYMNQLISDEPPEFCEEYSSEELIESLNNFSETIKQDDAYTEAVNRLNTYLLNSTKSTDDIIELLYAYEQKERRHIEKRGVLMREEGGHHFGEPAMLQNHKILGDIVIPSSKGDIVLRNQEIPKDSIVKGENTEKKLHNLDSFSKGNRASILKQYPDASFVFGPNQWKLKGRVVGKSEQDNPIFVSAPIFDETTNKLIGFNQIAVFDVSQTEKSKDKKFVYKNQEGVKVIKNDYAKRNNRIGSTRKEQEMNAALLDSHVKNLMNRLKYDIQKQLNQQAYREQQYEAALSPEFNISQ